MAGVSELSWSPATATASLPPHVPGMPPPAPSLPALAAQAFAEAVPGTQADGAVVRGFARLVVECVVAGVEATGEVLTAHVGFWLSGGPVGPAPVLATVDGYGVTPDQAVVEGTRRWATRCAPALVGAAFGRPVPGVEQIELTVDARRFHVAMARSDRSSGALPDGADPAEEARERFGGHPWLAPAVLRSGTLPMLTSAHSTVVAITVNDADGGRAVRVSVHGTDWWPSAQRLAEARPAPPGTTVLLEELAVITPAAPQPAITRAFLERTVAGLVYAQDPGRTAGWPGWWAHGGGVGPKLTAAEVGAVEAFAGALPPDHWEFLTAVTGSGVGPGYGLLAPRVQSGAIPLAHAGCGAVWAMRLDGPQRGHVWVDVPGRGGGGQEVAPSFTRWYSEWLDGAVRDAGPWVQWPAQACAGAAALDAALAAHDGAPAEGSIVIRSPGGFVPAGTQVGPCQQCVAAAARRGLAPTVFAAGEAVGSGSIPA